ncbi:nuclear transport factor 2 family protein [Pseudoalteromonas ruthenica]|uniref:nuclear transport factor 2 family protein n=1 Tax=Pseudoalteromonas ruthenica TaxID=151081 RepID=UPI00110BF41D|nr:nuclear transport factor 2 family protein [Pseudoalteromonas ruthenica]TMO49807.1 hypothetical protein CWC24_00985 [Pseudoalteromonas ruthenica]TMO52403.1 hypothetical protein CWC23_02750 [Pseudoalteromonas ruthenica]
MKYLIVSLLCLNFIGNAYGEQTPLEKGPAQQQALEQAIKKAEKKAVKKLSKEQQQAVAVVDALVDAYNNKDIDTFISYFAEDVAFYMFPNELMFTGKEQLIARYGLMFKKLQCVNTAPIKRIVHGSFVIDQELSESCSTDPEVIDKRSEVVTSYQVKDAKVQKVLFFKTTS